MSQYEIITSELELLLVKTSEFRKSSESAGFFETLAFIKQCRYLAPYNALLVMQQRANATFVLSADRWHGMHKRIPRHDVQPIVVMKIFGPVEFVYDIKDIDGIESDPVPGYQPNLPTEEVCRRLFPVDGDIRGIKGLFDEMVRTCRRIGLSFQEEALEIGHAGQVQLTKVTQRVDRKDVTPANRLTNYVMKVNSTHPLEIRFAAMVHELAHIFCDHLNEFNNPNFSRKKTYEEEFEAEAVSYLFCYRYGFRPRSEQYLSEYLREGREPSVAAFDDILGALKKIEDLMKPEEISGSPVKFSFTLIDHHWLSECRLILKGKELHYHYDGPDSPQCNEIVTQSLQDWDKFWKVCNDIGVWSWEPAYSTPGLEDEHHTEWSLTLLLGDRQITATGKNCFPGGTGILLDKKCPQPFVKLLKALGKLAGGKPIS
jgi:hypothetical protein